MTTKRAICLLAGLLMTFYAAAQVSTSGITGLVQDPTGAVVAGAKVVITNEETGVKFETTTTSAGVYKADALNPGPYTITVSHGGFQTFSSVHNVLSGGVPLVVNASMKVGAATETVQVESTYERIETTSAQISDVVTQKEIVSLPLNGRNPMSLIVLEPGLTQRTTSGTGSDTHVFGSRDRAHNVTIDGIDANESSVPNPQSNLYRLTPDNVEEFRVVTHNATAELGRNSGANVNVGTRSGTNVIHGDVAYALRNTALNADEWFNKYEREVNGNRFAKKATLNLHAYSADAGGPLIKDRTFWFVSYQGNNINQTQPIASNYGVPIIWTPSLRSGIYRYFVGARNSPRLVDPNTGALLVPSCGGSVTTNCIQSIALSSLGGIDPAWAPLIGASGTIPFPNDYRQGDGLNTAGFNWTPPSQFKGPFIMGRLDHKFNENNTFFGRYLWSSFDTLKGDFLNARPQVFPNFPPEGEVFRDTSNLALSYRHVFSPTVVNELTAGFSLFAFTFSLRESQKSIAPVIFAQDCFGPLSSPSTNVNTGGVSMPYCNNPHTQRAVDQEQIIDNLSWVRGSHSLRFGTNLRYYQHIDERGVPGGFNIGPTIIFDESTRDPLTPAGAVISGQPGMNSSDVTPFRNMMAMLLGFPAQVNQVFVMNPKDDTYVYDLSRLHTQAKQLNFYGQDEWKASPNLTINYGLRWEINLPPSDAGGLTFVPNKPIDGSQGPVSFVKADSWYKRSNLSALGPRIGIAWSPTSNMVVRAGYGIAFDTISTFQVTSVAGKVPGSVLQCKPTIGGTTSAGCASIPSLKLSPLLASSFIPLATPNQKPSVLLTQPAQGSSNAPAVGGFNPDLKMPTVHEWSLTVQRELPFKMVGQVGYIGKRGTHLFQAYDRNQLTADRADFLSDFLNGQRNLAICRANSSACLAAQAAGGVSSSSRTVDNFANWGLPGQVPLALLSALMGASTASSSQFRGGNATAVSRGGLGDLAGRIDLTLLATRTCPGAVPCAANFFRPNPQFGQIFYFDSGGDSYYHGLIFQLRRRFEKGLEFGFAYTYSRSIDDMSVDPVGATSGGRLSTTNSSTPTDIHNWRLDRSASDFDNTHVIITQMVYELPFGRGRSFAGAAPGWLNHIIGGWQVTSIFNYQSGEPFTIYSGARTVNGQHVSFADLRGPRPDTSQVNYKVISGIKGPVLFNSGGNVFDSSTNCTAIENGAAFCIPAAGTYGNTGRNAFRGPVIWNMDSGINKEFGLTERVKMQFRAEFFNLFNHPNWENPRNASVGSPSVTSSTFGQVCCVTASLPSSATVIATGEPNRVIQFGLKLSF